MARYRAHVSPTERTNSPMPCTTLSTFTSITPPPLPQQGHEEHLCKFNFPPSFRGVDRPRMSTKRS